MCMTGDLLHIERWANNNGKKYQSGGSLMIKRSFSPEAFLSPDTHHIVVRELKSSLETSR